MKWLTHEAGGLLAALLCQLSPVGIASAIAGSILPDVIDQKVSSLGITRKGRQKIFNKIHRGFSHWFGWWVALFIAAANIGDFSIKEILIGISIGALMHVLQDMLTTRGVPVFPFSRKVNVSLNFCATGSFKEYAFLFVLTCFILAALYFEQGGIAILQRIMTLIQGKNI